MSEDIGEEGADIVYREEPLGGLAPDRSASGEGALLVVKWEDAGAKSDITYKLLLKNGYEVKGRAGDYIRFEDAAKLVEYVGWHFSRAALGLLRRGSWDSVRVALEGLGAELTRGVVPPNIVEEVSKRVESGASFQIATNESWIPWELVFDVRRGIFWGEEFAVSRTVREGGEPVVLRPRVISRRRIYQILNIIGCKTGCATQARRTFDFAVPSVEIRRSNPGRGMYFNIADVVSILREGADLVHLTCHGKVNQLGERYLELGPRSSDHHLYEFILKHVDLGGKLIFINACCSVQPFHNKFGLFRELTTFGWLVRTGGDSALVGTVAPVPGTLAVEMSNRFYWSLFRDGNSVSTAIWEARRSLQKDGVPVGLLYALFGNPYLVRDLESNEQGGENG